MIKSGNTPLHGRNIRLYNEQKSNSNDVMFGGRANKYNLRNGCEEL